MILSFVSITKSIYFCSLSLNETNFLLDVLNISLSQTHRNMRTYQRTIRNWRWNNSWWDHTHQHTRKHVQLSVLRIRCVVSRKVEYCYIENLLFVVNPVFTVYKSANCWLKYFSNISIFFTVPLSIFLASAICRANANACKCLYCLSFNICWKQLKERI